MREWLTISGGCCFSCSISANCATYPARRKRLKGSVAHTWSNEITIRMGVFNASARHLRNDLGRRSSLNSGEARETSFLYQRISILVHQLQCCPSTWQLAGHWQHGLKIVPTFLISRLIFELPQDYIYYNNNNKIIIIIIWIFQQIHRQRSRRELYEMAPQLDDSRRDVRKQTKASMGQINFLRIFYLSCDRLHV